MGTVAQKGYTMRTMKLIAAVHAGTATLEQAWENAQANGWTRELFDRKVAQSKGTVSKRAALTKDAAVVGTIEPTKAPRKQPLKQRLQAVAALHPDMTFAQVMELAGEPAKPAKTPKPRERAVRTYTQWKNTSRVRLVDGTGRQWDGVFTGEELSVFRGKQSRFVHGHIGQVPVRIMAEQYERLGEGRRMVVYNKDSKAFLGVFSLAR